MKLGRAILRAAALCVASASASAQIVGGVQPPEFDWEQRLGAALPLETPFVDAAGRRVRLGDCVGDRPVVLALVYYECPMLCGLVLDGLVRSLKGFSFVVGREFDVLAISIDPAESHELAAAKKKGYAELYGRSETDDGWHFLVGTEQAIASVADAVGFGFVYVPSTDEYAHAAGITVLTPEGRVSRYFYGTEFAPRDLKFGLIEAADGSIGSAVDKVLLRCFHYDPERGRYGLAILGSIRVLGTLTVVVLAGYVVRMLLREQRRGFSAGLSRTVHGSGLEERG